MSMERTRLPNRQAILGMPANEQADVLILYHDRTTRAMLAMGVFSSNFARGIYPEGLSEAKIAELKITRPWEQIQDYLLIKILRMNSFMNQTEKMPGILQDDSIPDARKLSLVRQHERSLAYVLSSKNAFILKEQIPSEPTIEPEIIEAEKAGAEEGVEKAEAMFKKSLTVDNSDPEEPKILADGERIALEAIEEDLLVFLSSEAGYYFSRTQIIREILPAGTKALKVTELIDNLNKKLAKATGIDQVIESEAYRRGIDYLIDEKTIEFIDVKKEGVKLPPVVPETTPAIASARPKLEKLELGEIAPFTSEQAALASVILRSEHLDVDGVLLSFKLPHEISEACKKLGNLLPAAVGVRFYNFRLEDYASQRLDVLRSLYTILYNPTSMAAFLDGSQKNKVELEIKSHIEKVFGWLTKGSIATKSRLLENLAQISPSALADEWEIFRNPTKELPEPESDTQTPERRDLEKNFPGLDKKVDAVIAEVMKQDDLGGEIKLTAIKDKFPEFESKSAVEWAIKFAKLIQPKKGVSGAAIITMVDLVAYLSVSRLYPSKNKRRNKTPIISLKSGEIRSYILEKINEAEDRELGKG